MPASPVRPDRAAIVSTLAIILVINGGVGWAVFQWGWARALAEVGLLVYVAVELPRIARGGRRMLLAGFGATLAALAFQPDPLHLLAHALAEAAFVVGLFTSLGMLRDAAHSSDLVQRCGEQMVRQRPSRRYAVLALGSHMISLVLNFGVLPLLGVMVAKGNTLDAAGGDPVVLGIRNRRMMTAILRGFAMMTVWSPLSVSFAVTQEVMHGLPWWHLLPLQVLLASLLMALGWFMDRLAFPPQSLRLPPGRWDTDWRPVIGLCLLVVAVVVGAVALAALLDVRLVIGAMMVVPAAAVVWLLAQQRDSSPDMLLAALRHFALRLTVSLPAFRYEVAMLGGAMYLGSIVAAFISPEATAAAIARLPLPPLAVVIVLSWTVMVLAQIGISQIVSVTLLGSACSGLSTAGIPPLVLASGLMGAWALSACSTPVGAAVLTVARMAGVPVRTVARDWNGAFVVVGALVLGVWMVILSLVLR